MRSRAILVSIGCLLAIGAIPCKPALAETYVAGEIGVTLPSDLKNIDVTTAGVPPSTTLSDLDLDSSGVFGARIGHYFRDASWLGLETRASLTHPGIKQQDITLTAPGVNTIFTGVPGFNLQVFTWTPLALNLRYPGKRLQPYVGGGPAFFFAKLKDKVTGDSQNDGSLTLKTDDWRLGLNVFAGVRFYLTRNWAVFAEGQFTGLTRFEFKETSNLDGFDADYKAINGVVGIGFHF